MRLFFISHPEVDIDPARPVPDWGLNVRGRERATKLAHSDLLQGISQIWASTETKALETARILARPNGLTVETDHRLGENDRSATGYMPSAAFEAAADAFFAHPTQSHRGWETAKAAQDRIWQAVRDITADHVAGDLAIVSHGAVGTLLYCRLCGFEIDRQYDQPSQGHFWTARLPELKVQHGWRPIDQPG